ncbi:MAG TPA: TIM barrel protein [Terriglobia bacterium]|nr:TIM barrel protein [Terriglobia bacterium]
MVRRDFLARLAAGAAAVGLGRGGNAFGYTNKKHPHPAPSASTKLERIAISTWSLHNYFRATRRSDFDLPGAMLALLDFPELIVDKYQVHHFEFCTTHFPSTEPAYLRELKYALVHTRSTIVNMPVDIAECGSEGTFSDPDGEERRAALDAVKPWVDVAHTLGVKSVRVGPGKVDPENLAPTAESYKALAVYAQAKGVHVMVENHAGFGTEHPEELVNLLKLAGLGRIGALPDFANFPDEPTREKGLKILFPYAPTVCHAKGLEFDAGGAETAYDFSQAMEIAKKASFRGVYSIEFDGPGDPYTGIQKTLDELLKFL